MAINITRGTKIANFVYDLAVERSKRRAKKHLQFRVFVYQGQVENRITLAFEPTGGGRKAPRTTFDFTINVDLNTGAITAMACEKIERSKNAEPIFNYVRNLSGDALRDAMRSLLVDTAATGRIELVIDLLDAMIYVEPEEN